MHRTMTLGLHLAALMLATAQPLLAQTGTVRGRVTDESGRALPNAQVEVVGTAVASATRVDGTFELRSVPAGARTVRARLLGRRVATQSLMVRSGVTASVDIELVSDPLALDAVVVSGTFNPASKLESSTAITTVNPEELQQRAPRGTAELLKGVPGLQVMSNSGETGA